MLRRQSQHAHTRATPSEGFMVFVVRVIEPDMAAR
jgi:hypothetical protein